MASKAFGFVHVAAGILGFFAISTAADVRPHAYKVADHVLRDLPQSGRDDTSAVGDGTSGAWTFAQTAVVLASRADHRQTGTGLHSGLGTGLHDDGDGRSDANMLAYSGSELIMSTHPDRPQDAHGSDDRSSPALEGRGAVSAAQQAQHVDHNFTASAALATADDSESGDADSADSSGGAFRSLLHACHSRR